MQPTVEILLAAYNGAQYIKEQIDSILNQSDPNWHLTLSDDGSVDGTDRIIEEYVRRYPEKMKRVWPEKRFGNARDHFFWLMKQCQAPYMMFSDQDDVFYPEKVQTLMNMLENGENQYGKDTPLLVFSDQRVVNEHLQEIAPSLMQYQQQFCDSFDYRSILMQNVVTGGAMAINRPLAQLAGRYIDGTRPLMHDWWLAAVAARFGEILYTDQPLSAYRQHGDNAVGAKKVTSLDYASDKIMHLKKVRASIQGKKKQAAEFLQVYRNCLSNDDIAFLTDFAVRRSGCSFYWNHRKLIHGKSRLYGLMLLG